MRAAPLPPTDRLLSLAEVGERLHSKGRHLRRRVEASPTLRAGRRYSGRRAYFIESYVVRYMHAEMAAEPVATSAVSP